MLDDLRVLDLVGGIAGGYCTKLLADAGADVVVVEPLGGAEARRSGSPGLFDFLHTSKRSVTQGAERGLLGSADLVVVGEGFDVSAARRSNSRQVVVSITPFGLDGPMVGQPANEFTLQAICGSTGGRGLPTNPPLAAAGQLGEWIAGTYAAVGGLAAWMEAARSGRGDHVDVAMLDCMTVTMVIFPSLFADFAAACGTKHFTSGRRKIEIPSIERTADGFVNFTTVSAQQFSDLAVLIGHPELADDARFTSATPRFEHRDQFWSMTHAYAGPRSTSQVLEEAALLRIPVAPVLDETTVTEFEHFTQRAVFVDHPSKAFRQPRIPYRFDGTDRPGFGEVPTAGQHDGEVAWPARPAHADPAHPRLPLADVRVVDLTAFWAGPCATHVLACLGADVIKVESTVRPDLLRFASAKNPGDTQWWEWGAVIHAANTNKRGITLDLSRPEGREVLLALLGTADLIVENYTPRVLDQFGLGWERIQQANPQISLIRMPAFGLDGPWRDRPGFAQTMEALTGLAARTGFPDVSPNLVGGAGDPIAGLHATFAAMVALVGRETSGRGSMVESTMVEAVLNAAAAPIIAYQLTGEAHGRRGNRSHFGAIPQGVYPCRGDDQWVAIAVRSDAEWRSLVSVLQTGGSERSDREIQTGHGSPSPPRFAPHDEVDQWLSTRTSVWRAPELAAHLTSSGVPAAHVIHPRTITENEQLAHRGLFEVEEHPVTGRHLVPGLPFTMSRHPRWVRIASPTFGQHNDEVLAELGIDEDRRRELRALGVIGERPAGA